MAEITAKMVNELRQRTNSPMMDAKRALVDAAAELGPDATPDQIMTRAVDLLRERGSASADKKLTNEMKEGLVAGKISPDGKLGVLVRLGCQTDFVAKNDGFVTLLNNLVGLAFDNNV